ncbi:uncharacterized protein LOC129229687 [Uloborus diversus]|uniref:uncharacterized protein LOC129229687 n=1 Tax=Uloborus diversus TaxID=327109 RepID=UPI0024093608|nr:uncharacterized protein LOC129229687 [Uloborus diversus]
MESANDSFSPLTEMDIPYIDGQMENENAGFGGKDTNGTKKEVPPTRTAGGILPMCGRFSFPWLLTLSIVQLSIYLNKLYQDSSAVGLYFTQKDFNYCVVSTLCLFFPALVYIIYIVAAYVKDQEEAEAKEIGTKVVHGLLLVPWQIKGRVEVLQFSAQRVCQTRPLTPDELEEKSLLERQAAVLEFFENFYAGLTQILLQLYIIITSLDQKSQYKALTGEIIASILTLMSMLAAVRRKDDGILTGALSIIGWTSIAISRAVAISLGTTVVHGWMALALLLHGIMVAFWVTAIAVETHVKAAETVRFTKKRRLALFFLIFAVFGLPSLTYWPIMFELKKHKRPLIFLFILFLENILFVALWLVLKDNTVWGSHDYVCMTVTAVFFLLGALFILFYICCKPKYTDQVVYHDMKVRNADSFGMYFEFCDVAFKLSRKQDVEMRLKEIREQRGDNG